MRVLLLAVLLAVPALAGCAVPAGVNEESYGGLPGGRRPATPPVTPLEGGDDAELEAFVVAMREAARPRPPLADEDAYDRFLENATRWAADGVDAFDASRPLDESHPTLVAVRLSFDQVRNATGSDREVLAATPLHLALAIRWNLTGRDAIPREEAEPHARAARDAADAALASVREARERAHPAGRNALLRAEAVLSLALSQANGAASALDAAGSEMSAASTAIDARINARAVRFWLDEAERAGAAARAAGDDRRLVLPDDLADRARATLAEADALLARARENATAGDAPAVSDLQVGLPLVRALLDAGLPEGAWAATQGLRENLLVLRYALEDRTPTPIEVEAAWAEAAENVRTFRDAQRYDRALAASDAERRPFGGEAQRLELLRAYAAVALMRETSEERERVFGS